MEKIKITLNELRAFCESEQFQQFSIKPISPLRVRSYLANPRAQGTDVVLYMLIDKGEVVAFRTIFADCVFIEDDPVRFGWCSGVWVDPAYRGRKLWKELLVSALKDWEGRLMLTNSAARVPELYMNADLMSLAKQNTGYRFYLYPDFREILKDRFPASLKGLLLPVNSMARFWMNIQCLLKKSFSSTASYVESDLPVEACEAFLKEGMPSTLFRRGSKEFEWIVNYPWVQENRESAFYYPFSYGGIIYRIKTVNCFLEDQPIGFFIYSVVNGKMKVLYHYTRPEHTGKIASLVVELALRYRVSHLTVVSSSLATCVKAFSGYFLFHKKYDSAIYSSFQLDEAEKIVFDGDGDACFT